MQTVPGHHLAENDIEETKSIIRQDLGKILNNELL